MMKWICVSASICFSLIGCGIEPALSGKAYTDYQNSIKRYIDDWKKPSTSNEARRRDELSCRTGGVTPGGVYKPDFEKARFPGEKEHTAYSRLHREWQRCMLKKGYRYIGECYDNEIGRTDPACEGRILKPLNR